MKGLRHLNVDAFVTAHGKLVIIIISYTTSHTVIYCLSFIYIFRTRWPPQEFCDIKGDQSMYSIDWMKRTTIKSLDGLIIVLSRWFLLFVRAIKRTMLNKKERYFEAIKLIRSMSSQYGEGWPCQDYYYFRNNRQLTRTDLADWFIAHYRPKFSCWQTLMPIMLKCTPY